MTRTAILGGIVRVCSAFSALAWITVLWAIGSLAVVTLPLAGVAVVDAVLQLKAGESPTWRRFFRTMRERALAAAFACGLLAVPASMSMSLLWLGQSGAGRLALGAGLAMASVTAVLAVVAPYACLTAAEPSRVIHRIGFLVVTRPLRAILSVLPWAAMILVIAVSPPQISLIVAVVSVSLPALGSVAILTTDLNGARLGSRVFSTRSVQHVTSKGITS